jgi:hypothetical protein
MDGLLRIFGLGATEAAALQNTAQGSTLLRIFLGDQHVRKIKMCPQLPAHGAALID